jgi:predicted ATPase
VITRLAISGYRSIRDLTVELGPLNVVTGANGSGKSSLYRSLRLLSEAAQGRLIASLAMEGGLSSTLWAGPESISRDMKSGKYPIQGTVRSGPISLKLGFSSDDFGYAIDLGQPTNSHFPRDPEIKVDAMWTGGVLGRANLFAERRGAMVRLRRGDSGEWRTSLSNISTSDSMVTHCADPDDGLELLLMRERMRNWRFYDALRTDQDAPARRPQITTYTPVLASDGSDLAAAIATIQAIGRRHCRRRAWQRRDAPDRTVAPPLRLRAFRWHAALSAADRRAALPSPARADDPQRARGEPASLAAGCAGAAVAEGCAKLPDHSGLAQ